MKLGWANFGARSAIHPVSRFLQGCVQHRGHTLRGDGSTRNHSSIGVFGKYRIYITAPPGAEVFQQLFGRGPSRAGDREQGIEKMRLILASCAAASSPV